jgi:UDP-N-acetylmuramate dehydrogenase
MTIEGNYNLSKLNTFGIYAEAKFFAEIEDEADLKKLFTDPLFTNNEKIFLGGGSNVLLTRDWPGIVILNKLKGMEVLKEDGDSVVVRAMGGEVWHRLVEFASERGYWGIENLSLIPGSVGAAPMQNIGAYGAELRNSLQTVEAYEIATGEKKIFNRDECALGYRESIFKNKFKGKYFISAITIELQKKGRPNTEYKILSDYLERNKIIPQSPKDISDAVAAIRREKLPDPKIIGNAGSFFKNVFVEGTELRKLREEYPDISYFEDEGKMKIPAAWLIERAGWKGHRRGNVGVHEKQALVLVNYGGASGAEILELARDIIASVRDKFGLTLVPEVNIV